MLKRLKTFFKYYSRNKIAVVALGILILIIFAALFADLLSPYDYTEQFPKDNFLKPSSEHLMGTDNFGRDIFSRVLHGAQVSLKIAVPTPIVACTIIGAKQLGRISAKINLKVFTPASLADSIYSKFFTDIT